MKTLKFFLLLLLVGCNNQDNLIEKTSKDYIDFLSKEVKADFNVFVYEVTATNKKVFRINSGTYNLDSKEIPNSFFKYKDHYVFIFYKDSISSLNRNILKEEGLFEIKERFYTEEDYDEWILAVCNNRKFKVIKDSWYRPLDSLPSYQTFTCEE